MEVILGDNPFFGVNHRSQVKAAEYLDGKGDFSAASAVICSAYKCGVRRMMLSNHADLRDLLAKVEQDDAEVGASLAIALVIPYAQKFNQIVGSKGVLGIMRGLPIMRCVKSGITLLLSAAINRKPNIQGFVDVLIDSEIENIHGFEGRVTTLCLHNIIADLCLGLGRTDFVTQFCEVSKQRGYETVVITQNPLAFDKVLDADVRLCFSYNKTGFMVNPCLEDVQKKLLFERDYWGMAILASGAVDLKDALEDPFLKTFSAVLYATGDSSRAEACIPEIKAALG